MAKYNITEPKNHEAAYSAAINPEIMDDLQGKILNLLLVQRKFMDKDYSAKQLAADLGTNTRYISAVFSVKFHMNYATMVNKYRIEEAMSILVDKRYLNLTMEDIALMVGFSNRQSFYSSFYKVKGCTPREYKLNYLKTHPTLKLKEQVKKKSGRKTEEKHDND